MPQGSSAVRPTNGLYLLPFILPIKKKRIREEDDDDDKEQEAEQE